MSLLKIISANTTLGGFETYRFTSEGCETVRHFDCVYATTADGREWYLPCGKRVANEEEGIIGYVSKYDPPTMLTKVLARGVIDTQYWVEIEKGETFEERFAPFGTEWQLEQRDREEGY
jgi:hypothetical protein